MSTMVFQLLITGIAYGMIYSLVGIEYTLVWNSSGLLNFSHDKLITLGAYIFGGSMIIKMNLNNPVAIILTLAIMGVVGALLAAGVFNRLHSMRSNIFAIIGTVVLAKIISEFIRLFWGSGNMRVSGWLDKTYFVGGFAITSANIVIIVVAILLVAVLQAFFKFTKTGKAMRCVEQNKRAAALMGININRSICITTALSAMICAVIGFLVIPLVNISATMATTIGLKGFCSGVIGGFGYIPGAIAGGIFIGVVENLATIFIPAVYKDAVSFLLLIVFLLIKPTGFLGKHAQGR
ncbi:MAG: branched-chain amino acid ABC transporter permease [Lachnospiraceae bacterium]|jgi:branched-chain amino acid transport system permease protein|nr:branched-chain amino acid ABC transporter permease [Lachnospiraceae bacterium]